MGPLVIVIAVALAAAGPGVAAADPVRPQSAAGPAGQLDGLLGGFALGGERGPVHINADTMEFDYKTKVLTYRGAVTVTQADMTLRSNVLRVVLDADKPERPREVVAEGEVLITKG